VPVRTGMTKVGMPGAEQGWQKTDVTMATVMKSQGYATGQFGKNHQGDRDAHLPTMHGFDEFFGNLYHLNAEEEPENRDYPADLKLANGKTFREQFGPRGVLKCKADGKGGQTIEDTGPLTRKRMETIDEETLAAAKDFIQRQHEAGKPFFCWWNATRMHFRTHVKEEHTGTSPARTDEYHDGMVEHDMHVGELLKLLDDLGIAEQHHRDVLHRQRPALQHLARRRHHALPRREELQLGRRLPRAVLRPLAGQMARGATVNGIVAHEDWLPTFAAAGNDKIVEQLKKGVELNGRKYKNYIDGRNMLDYLSGKSKVSPRKEFIYVDDGGAVAAIRVGDWKAVYLENRAHRLQIWKEPFVSLRAPDLYNLRRDPFEKAKIGSNTYEDWYIDRAFLLGPMQVVASQFLMTMKDYPPSQVPGDWSLASLERQINAMTVGGH
jgi:arylsulfatase A-like enzyme